jgi:hypothetical protein
MSIREIPRNDWRDFLESFNRGHRAWLATVETAVPGQSAQVGAVEHPLHSVSPTIAANRVIGIEIRFQGDSRAREVLRIDDPVNLRVDETTQGIARGLEIVDADGDRTRILFRAAPRPEMLDGIAPGELSPK